MRGTTQSYKMITTLYNAFLACNGVCTDSRACQAGNLFVCLKGENFDGSKFWKQALDNGADGVIIENIEMPNIIGMTLEEAKKVLKELGLEEM